MSHTTLNNNRLRVFDIWCDLVFSVPFLYHDQPINSPWPPHSNRLDMHIEL